MEKMLSGVTELRYKRLYGISQIYICVDNDTAIIYGLDGYIERRVLSKENMFEDIFLAALERECAHIDRVTVHGNNCNF